MTPTDTDPSTDSTDYERVEDVEIRPGDVYIDLTGHEQQIVIVEAVGDITEIAPDAPVPEEFQDRVDRSPEGVLVKTDEPGAAKQHTALDAKVFRRFVFQGALRPLKRPKLVWALLWTAYRDELGEEFGMEDTS